MDTQAVKSATAGQTGSALSTTFNDAVLSKDVTRCIRINVFRKVTGMPQCCHGAQRVLSVLTVADCSP